MLKKIFQVFYSADSAEQYLSDSISLQDLERRQREISRGEAPYQRYARLITSTGHIK
jgi:hypothetical protein